MIFLLLVVVGFVIIGSLAIVAGVALLGILAIAVIGIFGVVSACVFVSSAWAVAGALLNDNPEVLMASSEKMVVSAVILAVLYWLYKGLSK